MKSLAVIPARGGSKRIPRKNIKLFHGKPMLARSLEAARNSNCFDEIAVSSDDQEICDVALKYGADRIIPRPVELADDVTPTQPVIQHAIQWYQRQGLNPKYVCCIYATAPFIRSIDIRSGISQLKNRRCNFVVGATTYDFPIQRALSINENGTIEMVLPEHRLTRSQDLPDRLHDAGQFYWGFNESWLNEEHIFGKNTVPIVIPRRHVQDIDTPEDWDLAEAMFNSIQKSDFID